MLKELYEWAWNWRSICKFCVSSGWQSQTTWEWCVQWSIQQKARCHKYLHWKGRRKMANIIDYSNLSWHLRIKYLKMRIQNHGKFVRQMLEFSHIQIEHIAPKWRTFHILDFFFSISTNSDSIGKWPKWFVYACACEYVCVCVAYVCLMDSAAISISDWQHYANCMIYPYSVSVCHPRHIRMCDFVTYSVFKLLC